MKIKNVIRRWCERCHEFTASWIDPEGYERCAKCDPPKDKERW